MEGRMKKYRQVSPERAKVWTEKSPKYHYNHHYNQQQQQKNSRSSQKVPVVYYLCRNRQLEHPHFMEVLLSSSGGLYLRDVIERLNVLRGRGMASMYSWSCKRSYKNGFVWHDLCDDDLILPAHGNEYVLKGSELFEESNSGNFSPSQTVKLQNQKALPEPPSSRSHGGSSSSSVSRNTKTTSNDDESSPSHKRRTSPDFSVTEKSSWNGSLSLTEYKVYKNVGLSNASTQTEENTPKTLITQNTCNRALSTDDGLTDRENVDNNSRVKSTCNISQDLVSPPPSTSSASSSSDRTDTLESLIRADAKKLSSFRILEEEEFQMPCNAKLKASNLILQLISCGSISVKDHSFGLISAYKPRFLHSKLRSPLFPSSLVLREIDCLTENPRLMGMNLEDKEYFSGTLVETSLTKEGVPSLKRSSSLNTDKSTEKFDVTGDKEGGNSTRTKCIPRSIKASLSKNPRCDSLRSPHSEGPRISSDRAESSRTMTPGCTSNGGSKRTTGPLSGKTNHNENVIKIEERLASGARVIIQSKVFSDGVGNS
ncbi:hypothetical protein OROGR_027678 [Orobanche gracilis]